ncbi:KH domain-containing protein 3 [Mustela nigripes]|uniref:KH domain-containing protein 3 n=1 Tax=Mustela nigripes TaxID=77151 RepID=UPI00281518EB|nr:KH domain-containing protein 3 [Mustela nigripes]
MATPRRFPTLVQLEQREGALFTVLGNLTKRPYWFHLEYLKSPKAVRLEAWLVEAIFGRGGEHIPHVEGVSQTLLHVNQWDPEGEAEILIFGRPYYQKDVSKMIMNLADYHRQLRAQCSEKVPVQDAATQRSPDTAREAATQSSPKAAQEAATQRAPDTAREAATQRSPKAAREAATQRSPKAAREAATQRSPKAAREAATQRSPKAAREAVNLLKASKEISLQFLNRLTRGIEEKSSFLIESVENF